LEHKEDNERRENESEEDRKERELRTKHKLFGNIEFVGELFKFQIVTETIFVSVLESLLGTGIGDDQNINDNTIEAAIRLINSNGLTIDRRIKELTETKAKRLQTFQEQIGRIYERFAELVKIPDGAPENKASPRIKILIKNMQDNRASGWQKSIKEDKTIKTKKEVE
jgi:hypothetical protein